MLKQFKPGSMTFGFIEGPGGYIVTENDFCHQVRSLNENIELRIRMPWDADDSNLPAFQTFTRDEIRAAATPIPSLREWAHYWGIKDRVAGNYRDFLDSTEKIGLSKQDMPKWGDDDRAKANAA